VTTSLEGTKEAQLWQRLDAAVPGGGIYFSRSARFAGRGVLPGFVQSAQGCQIVDSDGKSYLDFNCGNGPNLLGYRHPEVDAAAAEQAQRMDLAAFFPEVMPQYAEQLLQWGQGYDWTVFTKNGSDSTNLALRIMRVATNRPFVVMFNSAYHGVGVEIALAPEVKLTEQQKYVIRIPWNDYDALFEVAQKYGDQIAGVLFNPLDQSPSRETISMSKSMVTALHNVRKQYGCLLTLDDVRHGFRLHPKGSHRALGLDADLVCLGKALANGYSTSVVLGQSNLRSDAEKIAFTATYMFSAVAFSAGLKTLEIYQRDNVFDHLEAMGSRLCDGIVAAGKKHGHTDVVMSGPVTMPTFIFRGDVKTKRAKTFASLAARSGAIFHPKLNWFLSHAHKSEHIEQAISIAEAAFEQTPTKV